MSCQLINYVKADLSRIKENPSFWDFLATYFSPHAECFRYVVNLRVVHFSKKRFFTKVFIGIPAYCLLLKRERKYGIHANTNIEIGPGLHIVHWGGVFLNVESIGSNFTVFQNVTFGKRSKNDGVPTIGNNVTCCTGAVICGPIKIGDNSIVGANSYLDKDVDSNSLVAGVPAREIKKLS